MYMYIHCTAVITRTKHLRGIPISTALHLKPGRATHRPSNRSTGVHVHVHVCRGLSYVYA